MAYLYVFIDESGNYDFSPTGTSYWILTSMMCLDVTQCVADLHELKHRIIDQGMDLECFHAAEDRQVVRDQVFTLLAKLENTRVDSVVVNKCMAHPSVQDLRRFYPMMAEILLKYVFDPRGVAIGRFQKVFIFLDRASGRKKEREALIKALKQNLPNHLRGVPYEILMHQSASHPHLQMVDYFSWAIFQKWERDERRPYEVIRHLVRSEFPVFRFGTTKFY